MTDYRKEFIPSENEKLYSTLHGELNKLMMQSLVQNRRAYKNINDATIDDMLDIKDEVDENFVKMLLLQLCSGAQIGIAKTFIIMSDLLSIALPGLLVHLL